MNELKKFTDFVIEKRTRLGLSVADLSEKVFGNRRNKYLYDLEKGRRKGVTIDMMERILKALDTELTYNEL
jgi:transcriptional regulator with XRE-family HTH domain